jgi:hypothetical protein
MIPAYPGARVVPLIVVPSPAKLDTTEPPIRRAERVAKWWCSAVQRKLGRVVHIPGTDESRDLIESRYCPDLLAAARMFVKHDIAPAAWCGFSIDVWGSGTRSKRIARVPPLAWVFNPDRITERLDWFCAERVRYMGGQVRMGPRQRELVRRYEVLQSALLAAPQLDEALVRRLVSTHLPAGMYARLVAAAQFESAQTSFELAVKAREGEYLW